MSLRVRLLQGAIIDCINATIDARWEAAGRKPDTTLEVEVRRGQHWLLETAPTRPSISSFLRTVMRHKKWTQAEMSRRSGIHINILGKLVVGSQQSCAPETKHKISKLVAGEAILLSVFHDTDWGLTAEPNRTMAQERKQRRTSVRG